METSNDKVISTLNGLIETCRDGEQGYLQACEGIKDNQLKTLFRQYSQQRKGFAEELQAEVTRLGGTAQKSGTVAGSVHRGWINIKAAVTGKDEEAIIAECERGEDIAKAAYQEASKVTLPSAQATLVQRQSKEVLAAHDRIRGLEKAHRS